MELQISIGYKKEDPEFILHCSTSCIKHTCQKWVIAVSSVGEGIFSQDSQSCQWGI